MKQLPQYINLHILGDSVPIEGLFVCVTVKVSFKNNFDLVFGPSDQSGLITICKDDIIREAEKDRKLFIMDYGDPVEDFLGKIEITPLNKKALDDAMAAYNIFGKFLAYPEDYLVNLHRAIQIIDNKNIKTLSVEIAHDGKNIVVLGRTMPCG